MKKLTNLRILLDHFGVPNLDLAKAINVSPSMVSNWVQGKRPLRISSGSVAAIADYILSRHALATKDTKWFKKQFEQAAIPADFDSASDIRRNLIIWLADDGKDVMEILFGTGELHIASDHEDDASYSSYLYSIGPAGRIYSNDYSARAGILDISLRLGRIFETLKEGATIDICLSSEATAAVIQDAFVAEIIKASHAKNVCLRMLVAISSNSGSLSHIISAYIPMIASGKMSLHISHGMTQPIIYQSKVLIPDTCVVVITELPDSFSPPAALFITEKSFLTDYAARFNRIVQSAMPLIQFYPDSSLKGIADLLHREFSDTGDLDILNDSLNPLVLECREYIEILKQKGFRGNALEWRVQEYLRIKDGFENNMKDGVVFREIISAVFLKHTVVNGSCELPSTYFMDTGKSLINTKSCAAILNGYARMLETHPNYHLFVAPHLDEYQKGTRHIKHGRHVTLNPWREEQRLIFSNQAVVTHEFQASFNELWVSLSAGVRENTISLLRIMSQEIEKISG